MTLHFSLLLILPQDAAGTYNMILHDYSYGILTLFSRLEYITIILLYIL